MKRFIDIGGNGENPGPSVDSINTAMKIAGLHGREAYISSSFGRTFLAVEE